MGEPVNTVLETTKIVTVDQLSGNVLTSVVVTSADVISEHMEVTTMLHKGYRGNVVVMRN